ncbi:P-loop containing nucleoside triphosphate hydrolase protein [Cryphonectria parasitica EP155]|uniref:P-loop containing nucleoside triphosphate hydrolase protein n=1 Tax=Cryphonectria parasitica (strain ATCC 38755 / EP155) TaxID=660469 RepID=A0A9P4YCX1_CRYP1|nr:P-loop containing nucleoside triphosphate hydrolase protein [Cryphonectria parasitica EP155]KAF3770577.1 P-loop containing nucleoside triphosphate hydrolase protein [Cryphonectria parasitica EP155]
MAGSNFPAEPKKLHPFFTAPKPLESDPRVSKPVETNTLSEDRSEAFEVQETGGDIEEQENNMPGRKRRKAAEEADEDWGGTKKLRRSTKKEALPSASIMNHFSKINSQSVKTTSDAPEQQTGQKGTPLKKILQLNRKTGTIGSPPQAKGSRLSKQSARDENVTEDQKTTYTSKRNRRMTRIATITYGIDGASRKRIGDKIDTILSSPVDPSLHPKTNMRKQPRGSHPFFRGKPKKTSASSPTATATSKATEATKTKPAALSSRPKIFSSTPCSPRKTRVAPSSMPLPQFGMKSLGLKTPGARLPVWPPKDMVHIRGEDDAFSLPHISENSVSARKCKGKIIHISPEEMILNDLAARLEIPGVLDDLRAVDDDTFQPPPPGLRLPQKYFESGSKLEKRILREVRHAQHPALAQLRVSLVTSLAAFDRFTCESACWAQKYTPKSAAEVLQYGKEAFLLRDWLEALKVQSVDTGDLKAKPVKSTKPPRKRRKKNKLDSFIVNSDEEADTMDEVSDSGEDWSPDRRCAKKTVIRAGDALTRDPKDSRRLTNAVVISGPHGCGKTSAVYAIAKELGFEVFEINAGSRRSGKDVLEKIGDMTRNHLVQHHQTDASSLSVNEEAVAEDIKSGKQATMNSFFKAKTTPLPAKPKKVVKQELSTLPKADPKKTSPKHQKQSLILLDEVDILYEEDKNFWSTVMTLIAQSRRPFIMTCSDENLVPLQALKLHGIFRFSTPPVDLVVDRMLLIAACEGHALRRNAVEALYEAREQDLRACLMDLNYWCQFAVGDRRGGIAWFYPRWPKGCDIDEQGNIVRVISQDAYVEGLGWLAHDVLALETDTAKCEEELLHEARDCWQMDIGNWHESLDLTSWAAQQDSASPQDRLAALKSYEGFTDAMSVADLSSSLAFATSFEEAIDWTLPEITDRTRNDYILGRQLLDASAASTHDPLATSLPINLRCLARKNLRVSVPGSPSPLLEPLDETRVLTKIRQRPTAACVPAALTRDDFSDAFDTLATSDKSSTSSTNLDFSVFDGTLANVAIDVAPYVRSIVSFERELQAQRHKLSNLLSQGGTKRRKTRASHAALEGGSRTTTRRDKWFDADLNGVLVMRTAGEGDVSSQTVLAGSRDDEATSSSGETEVD